MLFPWIPNRADVLCRDVLGLVKTHQRRVQLFGSVYRSEVSIVEIYVLIELDIDPAISIKSLCQMLQLDRNSISRALASLTENKFVSRKRPSTDNRRWKYQILKKGLDFLELHDRKARSFVERHLAPLTLEEIRRLQQYQHRVSEALGAVSVVLRPTEHPFQEGMRRFTRAMGFIGQSLFGSGHSSVVWHLLSGIEEGQNSIGKLADLLQMHPVTLSQQVSGLVEKKLLSKRKAQYDKRVNEIELTLKGRKLLTAIEDCGVSQLKTAFLGDESVSQLEDFVGILEKHLLGANGEGDDSSGDKSKKEAYGVHLEKVRAFLLYHTVRLQLHFHAPVEFCSDSTVTYGLYQAEKLLAVAELKRKEDAVEVVNFAFSNQCLGLHVLCPFIERICTREQVQSLELVEIRFREIVTRELLNAPLSLVDRKAS